MPLTGNDSHDIPISAVSLTTTATGTPNVLSSTSQTYYIDMAASASYLPIDVVNEVLSALGTTLSERSQGFPTVPCNFAQGSWTLNLKLGTTGLEIKVPFQAFLGIPVRGSTENCPFMLGTAGATSARKYPNLTIKRPLIFSPRVSWQSNKQIRTVSNCGLSCAGTELNILGQDFLSAAYVMFDDENKKIYVAELADEGCHTSNFVELDTSLANKPPAGLCPQVVPDPEPLEDEDGLGWGDVGDFDWESESDLESDADLSLNEIPPADKLTSPFEESSALTETAISGWASQEAGLSGTVNGAVESLSSGLISTKSTTGAFTSAVPSGKNYISLADGRSTSSSTSSGSSPTAIQSAIGGSNTNNTGSGGSTSSGSNTSNSSNTGSDSLTDSINNPSSSSNTGSGRITSSSTSSSSSPTAIQPAIGGSNINNTGSGSDTGSTNNTRSDSNTGSGSNTGSDSLTVSTNNTNSGINKGSGGKKSSASTKFFKTRIALVTFDQGRGRMATLDASFGNQSLTLRLSTSTSESFVNPDCFTAVDPVACAAIVQGGYQGTGGGKKRSLKSRTVSSNTFLDESSASWVYQTDSVSISGKRVIQQFGNIRGGSSIRVQAPTLGLAPALTAAEALPPRNYARLLDNLVETDAIDSQLYSIDIASSSLIFGGIDKARFVGPLTRVPLSPVQGYTDGYFITVTGLTYSSDVSTDQSVGFPSAFTMYIDSTASGSVLPQNVYDDILLKIGASVLNGFPTVRCDSPRLDDFLTIDIASTLITIPVRNFVGADGGSGDCPVLIKPLAQPMVHRGT
jgi:hypothetical protein